MRMGVESNKNVRDAQTRREGQVTMRKTLVRCIKPKGYLGGFLPLRHRRDQPCPFFGFTLQASKTEAFVLSFPVCAYFVTAVLENRYTMELSSCAELNRAALIFKH